MPRQSSPAPPNPDLHRVDRLARAASRWLRCEGRRGPPGPAHRDLLAGVIAGLGGWLLADAQLLDLAAYALALLEREEDAALDTVSRLQPATPPSAGFRDGLAIAQRLRAAVEAAGRPGRRGEPSALA